MTELWGLTCAPASRLDEANEALRFAGIPSDRRVFVTTQPNPIKRGEVDGLLVLFDSEEVNISKWWNLGLDFIADRAKGGPYDVAWISSDVLLSPDTLNTVRTQMREENTVMAGPDWHGALSNNVVRRDTKNHDLSTRIPGVSFVLRGESGIRADPSFRWWLADDDLEWTCKVNGGTLVVAGLTLEHLTDGHPLDEPRYQAFQEDIVKFRDKWGDDPFHGNPPL